MDGEGGCTESVMRHLNLAFAAGCVLAACGSERGAEHPRPRHSSGDDYQFGASGSYRTLEDAQQDQEAQEASPAEDEVAP